MRQGEDDVEVGNGQEQRGLSREPVLAVNALAGRAMAVAAGVGGEMGAMAVRALVLVAAQQRRAADLEGVEDFPVVRRQPMGPGVGGQAGPNDVGQPQRGRPDDPRGRRFWTSARHERISSRATDRRD